MLDTELGMMISSSDIQAQNASSPMDCNPSLKEISSSPLHALKA